MIARALKQKILWSTFVQYAGRVLQVAIGIVTVKLLTNALGTAEYGVYGKITEYTLFFSVVANLGIFGNMVRQMADHPKDGKIFVNALLLRVGTALLIFGASILYALAFMDSGIFLTGLLFFTSSLFFEYILEVCRAMFQVNYLMGRYVSIVLVGKIVELGLVYWLSQSTLDTPFYFLGPLGGSVVAGIIALWLVSRHMKFIWKIDRPLLNQLLLTSLPFGIINILNNLYYRFLPSFFAIKALSEDQFGSYNLMLIATANVAVLSTFLMYSSLPILKASLEEGHLKRAKEIYKRTKQGLTALAFLTVVVGSLAGPFLLRLVSSSDFIAPELWFALPLLLLLTAISYFYDMVLISLFALEEDLWFLRKEVIALLVGGSILVSSLVPAAPEMRLFLVLLGAIAGELTITVLGMRKMHQVLK